MLHQCHQKRLLRLWLFQQQLRRLLLKQWLLDLFVVRSDNHRHRLTLSHWGRLCARHRHCLFSYHGRILQQVLIPLAHLLLKPDLVLIWLFDVVLLLRLAQRVPHWGYFTHLVTEAGRVRRLSHDVGFLLGDEDHITRQGFLGWFLISLRWPLTSCLLECSRLWLLCLLWWLLRLDCLLFHEFFLPLVV